MKASAPRQEAPAILVQPRAILVISAHFEYISFWRACWCAANKLRNRLR
jgi:hypothetical protein